MEANRNAIMLMIMHCYTDEHTATEVKDTKKGQKKKIVFMFSLEQRTGTVKRLQSVKKGSAGMYCSELIFNTSQTG